MVRRQLFPRCFQVCLSFVHGVEDRHYSNSIWTVALRVEMPFVANTPESFLDRSDSKNPHSTCRGITSSGRPCRRALAVSSQPTTAFPRKKVPDPRDESLYCWQHKEQAADSARSSPGPRATVKTILEERTSLDTLADRLGLVDLQGKPGKGNGRPGKKPQKGQSLQMTRPKQTKTLEFCSCFSIPIEEIQDEPKPRPQPRPVQNPSTSVATPNGKGRTAYSAPSATSSRQRLNASNASPSKSSYRSRKSTASQTAQLKDLVPDAVEASAASAILAELAKPYVDSEEPGYIYMFWLTPASEAAKPPVDAARSLLAPSSPAGGARSRRPSDVVSRFAANSAATNSKTIILKIGRAANVQRRMNQWQRQCGYDLEMLRYYPFVRGHKSPRQTPHVKRVERLIHLELAGLGMRACMDACETCGREHREWFEVDASRSGVKQVDEVIRRWVEWDEGSSR
ncbi:hypothetical protein NLU13_1527 [Sarocladium strictum]|uniref:Bacteriophage T5 Orf172 DNA-binding domain-containing protein n=1 Tax=Sarocladium strictum TaxID=5046 RepID=A0AA39LCL0_SARSR|nr:hypothetical protein NLU13_1527 [Sarocladium strictum]